MYNDYSSLASAVVNTVCFQEINRRFAEHSLPPPSGREINSNNHREPLLKINGNETCRTTISRKPSVPRCFLVVTHGTTTGVP